MDDAGGKQFEADGEQNKADAVRILPDDAHRENRGASSVAGAGQIRRGSLYTSAPEGEYGTEQREGGRWTADDGQRTAEEPSSAVHRPPSARPGPSACLVLAATFSLLAVACFVLAFATFQGGVDRLGKLTGIIPSFGINLVTTPTITIDTSKPAVIEQVRALSKLETVHYQLEKIITAKSSGPLFDFLTSDKILLVAHGEVVAGIDLNKVQSSDIEVVSGSISITLPQAEILSSKLDNEKTYVYDRQTGLLNRPDPNLESQVRVVAEQQIVDAAKEDGILDKASVNAEQTLRTLLEGLGYKDVEFKEGR